MSTPTALPIILVSAKSEAAATLFISEIIDNEPAATTAQEGGGAGRVWRIANKYYEADVRLVPRADDAPAEIDSSVEGHVIYLAEDECTAETGEGRWVEAEVVVAVCDTACMPEPLAAWCARRRVEPVLLREADEAEEQEPRGPGAVRSALHAHTWPGLRLLPRLPSALQDRLLLQGGIDLVCWNSLSAFRGAYFLDNKNYGSGSESSEGGEEEEEEEGGEEESVERAEQWAAALGAVEGVRALRGAERRAAAEGLLRAFLAALGDDLDDL